MTLFVSEWLQFLTQAFMSLFTDRGKLEAAKDSPLAIIPDRFVGLRHIG